MMKPKIFSIVIDAAETTSGEPMASVDFWRFNFPVLKSSYVDVTPSSLRRAQRAQLALMERATCKDS